MAARVRQQGHAGPDENHQDSSRRRQATIVVDLNEVVQRGRKEKDFP
jgi:hypothetical protein